MKEEIKKYLLELSRNTILSKLGLKRSIISAKDVPEDVKGAGACFVTLTISGELRGCIGSLEAHRPLFEDVISNSENAAFRDPRFPPLSAEEAESVIIEISVLTPRQEISYSGFLDLKKKIIPHKHGVYLSHSYYSATFLPQVWEQLPDKQEFLMHLCLKANLNPEAWKDKDMELYTYKVEKFVQ